MKLPQGPAAVDAGSREHYEDALLYDHEYRRRRRDVHFYRELAGERCGDGDAILELACGTGRVTAPLLRAGRRVIGIDRSQPMLARAAARIDRLGRAARARAALIRADARRFALAERFPLVIMAFNSFEHLYTRVDVAACLRCVREHLAPGGRFAFDVQNPNLAWLCRDPRRRWSRTVFRHPVTGERTEYTTNHEYDPISQIAVIRLYYEPVGEGSGRAGSGSRRRRTGSRVVTLSQRKFFPAELEALVHANGLAVEHRYGDFERDALTGDADSQVLVCRVART